MPAKTLNTWIQRGALDPFWLSGANQWKRFSLVDLAALCLVPELSEAGVPPALAAAWGAEIFNTDRLDFSDRRDETEAAFFLRMSRDRIIAVLPEKSGFRFNELAPEAPLPSARRVTILRAGQILADCFDRALAMNERPYKGRSNIPRRD